MPSKDNKRSLGDMVDFYANIYFQEGHDSFTAGKMALCTMLTTMISLEKSVADLFSKLTGGNDAS